MPDTSLAKVAFSIPSKSPLKRKSSDSNRDVAIDVNGQIERSKRQKSDDDNEAIDLTPSHQIPDVLGEVPVSLVPTGPRSERQTTSMPESQSSISSTAADQDLSKWGPGDWDNDVFDSDSEYMSVAVLRNLGNEISLLKFFLDEYKKFNIHLGDVVSGPRHKGFLTLITSTVANIETYTTHLRTLRDDKQRGNPTPGLLENVAGKITRKFKSGRKYLWAVMEEKVDMEDDVARMEWVRKKRDVLGDVLGRVVGYLDELGEGESWKEWEVRKMAERWEKRWRAYGDMDKADLKAAGWILEVE